MLLLAIFWRPLRAIPFVPINGVVALWAFSLALYWLLPPIFRVLIRPFIEEILQIKWHKFYGHPLYYLSYQVAMRLLRPRLMFAFLYLPSFFLSSICYPIRTTFPFTRVCLLFLSLWKYAFLFFLFPTLLAITALLWLNVDPRKNRHFWHLSVRAIHLTLRPA